jgi:putative intracellular protease/amidase
MKVLIPLPDRDFDVTEVAVPWRLLTNAGHTVVFATELGGAAPAADPQLFKSIINGAAAEAKQFYQQMAESPEFKSPIPWSTADPNNFDGLILPGGHAPGMRQYLGSEVVQQKAAEFCDLNKPVGAVCHGVLVLARAKSSKTGKSPLADKRTTCLPKYMEQLLYYLLFWRMGKHARTYPTYIEDDVKAVLNDPSQFERGPKVYRKKGTATDDTPAFVVQDGNYISARWPGDAYLFAKRFIDLLDGSSSR